MCSSAFFPSVCNVSPSWFNSARHPAPAFVPFSSSSPSTSLSSPLPLSSPSSTSSCYNLTRQHHYFHNLLSFGNDDSMSTSIDKFHAGLRSISCIQIHWYSEYDTIKFWYYHHFLANKSEYITITIVFTHLIRQDFNLGLSTILVTFFQNVWVIIKSLKSSNFRYLSGSAYIW